VKFGIPLIVEGIGNNDDVGEVGDHIEGCKKWVFSHGEEDNSKSLSKNGFLGGPARHQPPDIVDVTTAFSRDHTTAATLKTTAVRSLTAPRGDCYLQQQ
jgi:hypothetical protein